MEGRFHLKSICFSIVKYWPSRGGKYQASTGRLKYRTSSDIIAPVCRTRARAWHFTSVSWRVLSKHDGCSGFLGLALLVIILETHCCEAVKSNCRAVLGAPTRIVLPSPRQSEGLFLLLFSRPWVLFSSLSDPTRTGEYSWSSQPHQRHWAKSCNTTTVRVLSCNYFHQLRIHNWFL